MCRCGDDSDILGWDGIGGVDNGGNGGGWWVAL